MSEVRKMNEDVKTNEQKLSEGFRTAYAVQEEQKAKTEFVVKSVEDLASLYGIPKNIANMFFMEITGSLYIKSPGLLYLAGKKGDFHTELSETYDEKKGEWVATVKVFPRITIAHMRELEKFQPDVQKTLIYSITQPITGIGRASKENVSNSRIYPFLRELAQTRALDRALRIYTHFGGTSYSELPETEIEK